MNIELDVKQLVQVFDSAISSDNPQVKDLLRKLIMFTLISEETDKATGPFMELLYTLDVLQSKVLILENQNSHNSMHIKNINDKLGLPDDRKFKPYDLTGALGVGSHPIEAMYNSWTDSGIK